MDPASLRLTSITITPPGPGALALSGALVLLLIFLMGAFAMAEAALLALRPTRVEQMLEEGRRGARAVQKLTQNQARTIATAQVGTALFGFAAAAVAATSLALPLVLPLERLLSPIKGQLGEYAPPIAAATLVTIPVAVVAMVFGGLIPKSQAHQAPDYWAMRLAPLLTACTYLFAPFTVIVLGLSRLIVPNAKFVAPMMSREEFEKFVDDQGKGGGIDEDEEEIIKNVIDFSEKSAREVMTPRVDMAALPVDAPLARIIELILSSGHTRIPVYEGTIDNIIGILHAKDLLQLFADQARPIVLRKLLRSPLFVAESKPVSELLAQLRQTKQQLAIVQDEYAGTEGIVTIEDLVEEIVGEIEDEHDDEQPETRVLSETETLLDSRLTIADVNERLGITLSDEDFTRIGGYVFGLLGREPHRGDRVETEQVDFVVEELDDRWIKTLRAIRRTPPPLLDDEDGV